MFLPSQYKYQSYLLRHWAGLRDAVGSASDSKARGPSSIPGHILSFLLVSYWRKYVHEALVNRLGGLSQSKKSVVRLTDRPNMTIDVYPGRKTTTQQQQQLSP